MGLFQNLFGKRERVVYLDSEHGYRLDDGDLRFNSRKEPLEWSLTNPVLGAIFNIRAKVFSSMDIRHVNKDGEDVENSAVLKLLDAPNIYQSRNDFLYQMMWFLSAYGWNYIYTPGKTSVFDPISLYNLDPRYVKKKDKDFDFNFILDSKEEKEFLSKRIDYRLNSRETIKIELDRIIPIYDLVGNLDYSKLMESPSRLKQVEDVLHNIDENIKSKNINLKLSRKYLVKNKVSLEGQPLMSEDNRKSIIKALGRNNVLVTDTDVDGTHLISDFKRLFLDEMFASDAVKVSLAYEMGKDVLNYYGTDSTFENQKNGVINWIQNSIKPDADNLMLSLSDSFDLLEKGERLVASFSHLPIMRETVKGKVENYKIFQEAIFREFDAGIMSKEDLKDRLNNFRVLIDL